MDFLDIRTLLTGYVVSLTICTTVIGILWRQKSSRVVAKGFWFASFVLQLLAMVLITLRGVVPELFSIVVSGVFVVCGVLFLYMGLERYVDQVSTQRHNHVLILVFTLAHGYFTFVTPSLLVRSVNYSVALLLMFGQCAWLMLRRVSPDRRDETGLVGAVFVGYCLMFAGRMAHYMVASLNNDYLHSGAFEAFMVLCYQVLVLALTFSLTLMVTRRLRKELENDIELRKASEQAVRLSESRLTRAELTGKTGYWELHLDSQLIVASSGAASVYGLDREQVDYGFVKNAALPAYRPKLDAAMAGLIRQGGPYTEEFKIRAVDTGQIKDVRSTATYDAGTRTVFGVLLDITEQKRAEAALRASEAQYRSLFENSLDGVLLAQPDGRIMAANPEAMRNFGYSRQDMLGLSQAALLDPADETGFAALMQRLQGGNFRGELNFVRKDGSTFPAEVTCQVSSGESGQDLVTVVFRDITERKKSEQELVWLAQTDALTGLKNRRHFMHLAGQEAGRAMRYARPLSMLMMDLDHFKLVNDTHGHAAGDRVLQILGGLCRDNFRQEDVVGRLGGEEFAVILPETRLERALEVAERFRQIVADTPMTLHDGVTTQCSLSVGVSTVLDGRTDLGALMSQADAALYDAKHQGRNRVCVFHAHFSHDK